MAQDLLLNSDSVKDGLLNKVNPDLTELYAAVAVLTAGSGVAVSPNDIIVGFLNGKIVVDEDLIVLKENNDGGNETLSLNIQAALRKFVL